MVRKPQTEGSATSRQTEGGPRGQWREHLKDAERVLGFEVAGLGIRGLGI